MILYLCFDGTANLNASAISEAEINLLNGKTDVVTGSTNNASLVTRGYVDDAVTNSEVKVCGVAYYPATTNCVFSRAASSSWGDLYDADCVSPVIEQSYSCGTWSTADANAPQITISNLPAGTYQVIVQAWLIINNYGTYRLTDGTNHRAYQGFVNNPPKGTTLTGIFRYTSAGTRTFKIQSKGVVTQSVRNDDGPVGYSEGRTTFTIIKYPL